MTHNNSNVIYAIGEIVGKFWKVRHVPGCSLRRSPASLVLEERCKAFLGELGSLEKGNIFYVISVVSMPDPEVYNEFHIIWGDVIGYILFVKDTSWDWYFQEVTMNSDD